MKKKLVSLMMALLLVCSLVPTAFAVEKPSDAVQTAYWETATYMAESLKDATPGYYDSWNVFALARAGVEVPEGTYEAYLAAVEEYVKENINEKEQLHATKPTENEKVIIALTAIGVDVTNVSGHNLLAGLSNMAYTTGQGLNSGIYGLLAFDCGAYTIPEDAEGETATRDALVDLLLSLEISGGGWALWGATPDPDMTAMTIQALAPYYKDTAYAKNKEVKASVDHALDVLSGMQNENGAFSAPWVGVTAESVAQVVTAVCELGIDPATDSRFVKNGKTMLDALCDFAVEGGGFAHSIKTGGEKIVNPMATQQSFYALNAYMRLAHGQKALYDMTDVDKSSLGSLSEATAHVYDNSRDDTCNLCGFVRDITISDDALTAQVYVTISKEGTLVMAEKAIEVTDLNGDGKLDVDETLYAAHEAAYPGGASAGYQAVYGAYGLSLTKLWGDMSGAFGYWCDNVSCMSAEDEVQNGSHVAAFIYADQLGYSDAYAKITLSASAVKTGEAVSVSVEQATYDEYWNTVFVASEGYVLTVLDAECKEVESGWQIKDGAVIFDKSGEYLIVASREDGLLVPCAAAVTVTDGYEIINGAGQTVEQGQEAVFRSNADFSKFVKVQVDGADVDAKNYTVKEGSTIVTLKASYLKELSVGTHTLTIVSDDGEATTTFTVKADAAPADGQSGTAPATGDTGVTVWASVLVLTALGGAVLVLGKKRRS